MSKVAKRIKAIDSMVDRAKVYSLAAAIDTLIKASKVKFDETFDISINLGIDVKQSDQNVRVMITLPHGTGKKTRVAVFAKGAKADEAKAAKADIVGDDDLIEKILGGMLDFDRVIATPDMMASLGKVAKILGPKGLMPNPKLGTVTMDVKGAVEKAHAGQVEARADKEGIVHAGIGKLSFGAAKLAENAKEFMAAVQKAKPANSKGVYIKKVCLSSTMGPGLRVDAADFK